MSSKLFLAAGMLLFLAGCAPLPAAEAPPSAAPWMVEIEPSLSWMGDAFSACALRQSGFHVVIEEVPPTQPPSPAAAVRFQWGDGGIEERSAYPIGQDSLVFVVNPANSVAELTYDQIQSLYAAQLRSWRTVNGEEAAVNTRIHYWVYPLGNEVQTALENGLRIQPHNAQAVGIAPHPQAMRQAVAADPAAVGFLPRRWLDSSVKEIALTSAPVDLPTLPILAVSAAAPSGSLYTWLYCLQETYAAP